VIDRLVGAGGYGLNVVAAPMRRMAKWG